MDKKYQVFISSTYTDLKEERQAVVQTILDTDNIPAGMELFKGGKSQKATIERWIKESDMYLLILGGRYGQIDEETGKSYTEWEYDLAVELNKPLFAIVLSDDYVNSTLKPSESDMGKDKYISFKSKVIKESNGGKIVGFVDNIDQIKNEIYRNIPNIEKEHSSEMVGWVSADQVEELNRLKEENKRLSNELLNRQDEVISMQKELSNVKDDYIGSYKFLYVKEKLNNQVLDPAAISKALSDIEISIKNNERANLVVGYKIKLENQKSDLIAIIEKNKNALEWLVYFESKLLTENLKYYSTHIGYNLMNEYVISWWFKFSLIEKKTEKGSSKVTISLTENGRKFLSMLEMEEEQTK